MRAKLLFLLALFVASPLRAAPGEDDEAALLVKEGRAALAAKQYDRAAAALDRALAADPRRLDAYLLRAGVHAVRGEYDRGVALLRRAQALAPDSLEVQAALGAQLGLRGGPGDADAAVALLESVVERAPGSYQAHATLARQHAARGRWREAAEALRAYLRSRPAALAGDDGNFRIALAEAELRGGDPRRARQLFDEILTAEPRNTQARIGAAWAAAAADCRAALPELEALARLAERHPEIWLVTGRCMLALGRNAEAKDLAERYLARVPDAAGHALHGEAILAGGNAFEARRELAEAVRLEPRDRRHLVRWARAARLAGDAPEAAARLATVTAGPGDEPELTAERAECLLAAGRPTEAAAALSPIVEQFPDDAGARIVLGAAFLAAGEPAAALPHLEVASSRGGGPRAVRLHAQALEQLGTGLVADGDAAEGERHLARAVEIDPTSEAALVNLGAARLALGDARGALAPLERAARPRKNANAMQLLARAMALTGEADKAVPLLEATLPLLSDPVRVADVTVEIAAAEVDAGEPARAAARLDAALARAPAAARARLEVAAATAARIAAARAMGGGSFASAQRLLERGERALSRGAAPGVLVDLRCELALAATGAGDREAALAALKAIGNARCPFARPADELAAPILVQANTRPDSSRVEQALGRMTALGGRASGPAAQLAADATRWLALRAAASAHARGKPDRARRYLAAAERAPGAASSRELIYAGAVLDLEAGRADEALRALERLADDFPEALVPMGLAYEKKGDSARALELYQRALSRGVKSPGLTEWIEAKQRIHGGAE